MRYDRKDMLNKKEILYFFLLLFSLSGFFVFIFRSDEKCEARSIEKSIPRFKINIISNRNGVGLSQDIDILQSELEKLGHQVFFIEDRQFSPTLPKVDINLFDQPAPDSYALFLHLAEVNYLLPHPEWTYFSSQELKNFDLILCKTKEGERIFNSMGAKTMFLGFTSKDCYDEDIKKNYKLPFHLAGASTQKGTDALVKIWADNPQFPLLTIVKHRHKTCFPPMANVHLISEYLGNSALRTLQNSCGLHICPSETEGFGHYILEAMSCGAVVITTDAPPMNEFIFDKCCLVEYNRKAPLNLATNYYVNPSKLEFAIENLLSLSEEKLKEIGKNNRHLYLERDRAFKEKLAILFGEASVKSKYHQFRCQGDSQGVLDYVKNFLPENPIILECGAYNGDDTIRMAKYWPKGTIHAFEPVPIHFQNITEKIKNFPNIQLYKLALADVSGNLKFYLSDAENTGTITASSSLLPAKDHVKFDNYVTFNHDITVEALTLDDWAHKEGIDHIDFMWLDMQGFELNMLKPCKMIKNISIIYMEVEFIEAYEGQSLYPEIKEWMRKNDFELVALDFDEKVGLLGDHIVKPGANYPYYGNAVFINSKKLVSKP